jgi:hypothetical protein
MHRTSALTALLIASLAVAASASAQPHNFRAHLTGDEEVPPAQTRAQGQAIFQVNADETQIRFRLNVANINNITQAHIHVAPFGQNGPVVVWLFPDGPPATLLPGRVQGVLAAGVIRADDLVGPLAGQTISDLVDEMFDGETYVNVHTSQFLGGEVRGQIFSGSGGRPH